jgi:hypothetical protein
VSLPDFDPQELMGVIKKMTTRKHSYDYDAEMLAAADFVADFGSFGELFEEPDLTRARYWTGDTRAAWALLGHWSVQRNDPAPEPPAEFDEHVEVCPYCMYLEEVWQLRESFQDENCPECGLDLDQHDIGPDPMGKAHAWCRDAWTRVEPVVGQGGDAAEYQTSDAFNARWTATLSDGHIAMVTRTYYVGQVDEDDNIAIFPGVEYGVPFVERQDEYLVCTDPAYPGDTEIASTLHHTVLDDPDSMDPQKLATDSFEPEAGEWNGLAPEAFRGMLVATAALVA